jgi:hypothetical protein
LITAITPNTNSRHSILFTATTGGGRTGGGGGGGRGGGNGVGRHGERRRVEGEEMRRRYEKRLIRRRRGEGLLVGNQCQWRNEGESRDSHSSMYYCDVLDVM